MKKEVPDHSTKFINIIIVILVIFTICYFAYSSFGGKIEAAIHSSSGETRGEYESDTSDAPSDEGEVEKDKFSWSWAGGGGGGGGRGSTTTLDDGSGGGGGTTGVGTDIGDESDASEEDHAPEATLELNDFDYNLVSSNTVEVTSLSYTVRNSNYLALDMELLIYIYDEMDEPSKKGLVRDQIDLGTVGVGETIVQTSPISAFYLGDISTEKTLKLNLIGRFRGDSHNLASVEQSVLFS